ncbi:NAD(P)-dependent oxidoreductase [Ruegeria sp. SCP11]|uniref:NAD(P)-dependent oxidoreductase n=1 Tax=Ruegeria sp. SCP11 TaxID=3141378 RepID=UPI00333CBA91
METQKFGQIGLGTIGIYYAKNLLKAGHDLTVFDIDADRIKALEEIGASGATSAQELAKNSDVLFISLPNPDVAKAALLGENGVLAHARPGTLIVDSSTIDPNTVREFHQMAEGAGVDYVEAPVSGGEPMGAGIDGARAGNLTFMCGGTQKAFDRAKPIIEQCGKHVLYLGEAGNGAILKLISNLASGIYNLVAAEALTLASAAGFSPETVNQVFERSDGKSYTFTDYVMPRLRRLDFDEGFAVDLQYKDHRLVEDLARELKVPLPINSLAMQLYQFMRADGFGKKDYAYATKYFADRAHTDVLAKMEE